MNTPTLSSIHIEVASVPFQPEAVQQSPPRGFLITVAITRFESHLYFPLMPIQGMMLVHGV